MTSNAFDSIEKTAAFLAGAQDAMEKLALSQELLRRASDKAHKKV